MRLQEADGLEIVLSPRLKGVNVAMLQGESRLNVSPAVFSLFRSEKGKALRHLLANLDIVLDDQSPGPLPDLPRNSLRCRMAGDHIWVERADNARRV